MKVFWKKLVREPLLHFTMLGMGLFGLHAMVAENAGVAAGAAVIRVDEKNLTTFMQFRAKAFNAEFFQSRLAAMSAAEREKLIADYVREEVLYREAKSMGMDADDYIIRRRLVQKLEFVTRGITSQTIDPSTAELEQYFNQHREDYYVEPSVTFTHVFFDAQQHGREEALQLARAKQAEFAAHPASFADSVHHGERFAFHLNYVEKIPGVIASHFGKTFAERVFSQNTPVDTWIGPVASDYGAHLVLISRRSSGYYPGFSQVSERVAEEYRRARIDELQSQAIDAVIDGYRIELALGPQVGG